MTRPALHIIAPHPDAADLAALNRLIKHARARQEAARTARLRDAWRCLAAHLEAMAQEVRG